MIEVSAAKAAATCPPASKFETLLSPILEAVTLEFNKVDILVNPVPPALAASVPDSSLRAVGIVVLVGCAPILAGVTFEFSRVATLVNPVPPALAGKVPETKFESSAIVFLRLSVKQ